MNYTDKKHDLKTILSENHSTMKRNLRTPQSNLDTKTTTSLSELNPSLCSFSTCLTQSRAACIDATKSSSATKQSKEVSVRKVPSQKEWLDSNLLDANGHRRRHREALERPATRSSESLRSPKEVNSLVSNSTNSGKKDLFRAFLDIRPHVNDTEGEKYSRIQKITSQAAGTQSSREHFAGGYNSMHERDALLKPRFSDDQLKSQNHQTNVDEDTNSGKTETKEKSEEKPQHGPSGESFGTGTERYCIKVDYDANKNEQLNFFQPELTTFKPSKNFDNSPQTNTFHNVFGGSYEESNNRTHNNNDDKNGKPSLLKTPTDGHPEPALPNSRTPATQGKLYRVSNGQTRCLAWAAENKSSKRVMCPSPNEASSFIGDSSRPQKRVFPKCSSNFVSYPEENYSECSSKTTPRSFKPTKETNEDVSMSGEGGYKEKVTFSGTSDASDLYTNLPEDYCCIISQADNDSLWADRKMSIQVTKTKKPGNTGPNKVHPLPVGGEHRRSECNWFRDKHALSKDFKTIHWPECKYNFKCL